MLEHQDRRSQERNRVGHILAGYVGSGAVHGLKHRTVVSDVRSRNHSEAADEACSEVRDDVSVEVLEQEDVELSRRLRRLSRPARIRVPVVTSGRRWESRGVWRTIALMWWLRWRYWRGTPADVLARSYR